MLHGKGVFVYVVKGRSEGRREGLRGRGKRTGGMRLMKKEKRKEGRKV